MALPERGLALLRDRDTAGFLGVSLLVGTAVGLGAAILVWVSQAVVFLFEGMGDATSLDGWFPIVSVPLGLLLAWWLARRFAPEVAGDGVPEASAAIGVHSGYMATRSIPLKIAATALTLGGGGSAGREGPIVQIGGAIGSSISRHLGLGEEQVKSLVAAGAAAGIGASFNAPIAGMLFALEVILGSFSVTHMSAVVVSSIAAAVTMRSLVGEEQLLRAGSYSVGDPRELILYAGLAILAVVAAFAFLRLLDVVERTYETRRGPAWLRPVGLGLAIALIGVYEPRVLGTGQKFVTDLLTVQSYSERFGVSAFAASALLVLVVGKVLATSATLASGGSGGAFMPSLFIGAALGAGYAELMEGFWGFSDLRPGAFAVVGMATVFAAVGRAPLTAILLVFEITGANEYGLVLPLMLSATFAAFVADRVHPLSVYTMALERRGIRLRRSSQVDLLETVTVGDVMITPPALASPLMDLSRVDRMMRETKCFGVPVLDASGRLVGMVTSGDIMRGGETEVPLTVADVMTTRPVTVSAATPVSQALERMAVLGVGRFPVVADDDPQQVIGLFRRDEAVLAYHQALGRSTDDTLARERFKQRTDTGTGFYDFRIPAGSIADGKLIRDVSWPEGSTLVSVRRGTEVEVPAGATLLVAGDVITAFGTNASRHVMINRLNAGADEPTAEIFLGDEPTTEMRLQEPPPS